jgi:ketosteroid isomerase-like protein
LRPLDVRKLFAEDASFVFVGRDESMFGRAAIREVFAESFADFSPRLRHLTTPGALQTVAPDIAAMDGRVQILVLPEDADGDTRIIRDFAIHAVLGQIDGEWRVRTLRVFQLPLPD